MALLYGATVAVAIASAVAFDLQIVHWNDVHARTSPATEGSQQLCLDSPYNDTECYGGHARVATICKQAKADNPATLCIDAGDEFLGTVWDVLFEGEQTPPVLEAVGADVMTTGNHEFDYGVSVLASFVNSLPFPMLGGCNMDTTAEPSLNIKKWHVVAVEGRKVALLGYIAPDTGELSKTGAVQFSDPMTAVPACIEEFKSSPDADGVDIIGLVSHAGLPVDMKMAAAVPQAAFIVSAHSHNLMFPGLVGPCLDFADGTCQAQDEAQFEYPLIVAGTPILQQYYASKYVGVSTLTFSDSGDLISATGEPVALGVTYDSDGVPSSVAEDEAVVALLADKFEEVVEFSSAVIGALAEPGLPADRPDIRMREMALGNTVCDAMIASLKETGFQESEGAPLVCLANGGGVRAALPGGEVTYGDVTTVFPFGTIIEVLAISGAQLKDSLAFGVDSAQDTVDPPGKFPHIGGGLSMVLDYQPLAATPFTALVSLQHNCQDIPDDATFHLATDNFIAGGGDGYALFATLPRILLFGPSVADALADYIDFNTPEGGVVPAEAIDVEGRIVAVEDVEAGVCFGAPGAGGDDTANVIASPGTPSLPSVSPAQAATMPPGSGGAARNRSRRPRPADPARVRAARRQGAYGE